MKLGGRHLLIHEIDVPPELPPGWEVLGIELVVPDELGRPVDSSEL